MKLITVPTPSFSQRYQPRRPLRWEQWESYKCDLLAEGCTVEGNTFDYTVTWPESEHTYAPTLSTVHKWLYSHWGPFYVSWRLGRLCPFHASVRMKNMTCCHGNIRQLRCQGLPLEERHVRHLPIPMQHRLVGRVICYRWAHVLSDAYWEIDTEWLVENLPDDPQLVAFHIMRRVFRETGWFRWARELAARKSKRWGEWLSPFEW